MKLFLLLLAFPLFSLNVFSQNDSLGIFNSSFEKNLFNKVKDSSDVLPIELFAGINYDSVKYSNIQNQIENVQNKLEKSNIRKKSLKKQIKIIYKTIHLELFKKYDEDALFYDIESTGNYNCVSATAVYAIVLDYFQIDFAIKERPQHVYLIVNPTTDAIIMESTNPSKGVLLINDNAKKDYIKYLRSNKIISESDYESKSINELFIEHYYKDETITINELAGLHYYNHGIAFMNKELYLKASYSLEKALMLYPESELIKYNYSNSLAVAIDKEFQKEIYSGYLLGKYINLNHASSESMKMAENQFNILTDELVLRHPDLDTYTKYYDDLDNEVCDTIDISKINRSYFFYLGYYYNIKQDFSKSLSLLDLALMENPEDITTKQLIHDVAGRLIDADDNYKNAIDSCELYFDRYTFLIDYKSYQEYYTLCYMVTIASAFDDDNEKTALEYYKRMGEAFVKYDTLYYRSELMEDVYAEGYYYYNRNRKGKSKGVPFLIEGLKVLPNSERLKDLLESANRAFNYSHKTYTTTVPPAPSFNDNDVNTRAAEFQKDFNKYFKGCWKAVSKYQVGKKDDIVPVTENQKIQFVRDKQIKFVKDNKVVNGKWSLRPRSRLLYLIPGINKSEYILYKVVNITDKEIHLRVFKNNRKTNTIIIFRPC